MHHVRQFLLVHLLDLRPVGAVERGHVEIVALVAPRLVEDLLELGLGIDVGAERGVDAPCARLGHRLVGVHDEHRGTGRAACAASPAAARATTGAIQQLVSVGAHVVVGDGGHERHRLPIAKLVPVQRASAVPGGPGGRNGLREEHGPRHARLDLAVLPWRDARHGDDAAGQPVEVDRDAHRAARGGGAASAGRCGGAVRAGAASAATASAATAARSRSGNAGLLVALRHQRAMDRSC